MTIYRLHVFNRSWKSKQYLPKCRVRGNLRVPSGGQNSPLVLKTIVRDGMRACVILIYKVTIFSTGKIKHIFSLFCL